MSANLLQVLGTYASESSRAALTELLHVNYGLPRDRAACVLLDVLAWMRSAVAPTRYVRDPEKLAARRGTLLAYLRAGATNAEIAEVLGISTPRVSQLVAQLAAEGADVPARRRGRPLMNPQQVADVYFLLQKGHTAAEIKQTLDCGFTALSRAMAIIRKRGEVVPDLNRVEMWRAKLDALAVEERKLIHDLDRKTYEVFSSTPEKAQIVKEQMEDRLRELRAATAELEGARPPGVVTVPDTELRIKAGQLRAEQRSKEAQTILKKPAKRTRAKPPVPPVPPVPAKPLAVPLLEVNPSPVPPSPNLPKFMHSLYKKYTPGAASNVAPEPVDDEWERTRKEAAEEDRKLFEARKEAQERILAQAKAERDAEIAAELEKLASKPERERATLLEWGDSDVVAAAVARWPELLTINPNLLD